MPPLESAKPTDDSPHAPEDGARWYVIQAHARQTERAEINLQRQGYTVYCPRLQTERIRRNRRLRVEVPLFSNYLFVRLHEWHDNWYPLRSTRGVARLVTFGSRPLPVHDDLIAEIRRRIEHGNIAPAFEPGERVSITQGAFKGLEAIFRMYQGEQRALLLIELLHREMSVTMPVADLRCLA
jgi:transcriptional antiterminator RfaH